MPIFRYRVLNGRNPADVIEVWQELSDKPLTRHPLTNEPVERLIGSPTLSLRHASNKEKNCLSPDSLLKNGFSIYERSSRSKVYLRTLGREGPDQLTG